MGLKLASTISITFLFALVYAIVFAISILFLPYTPLSLIIVIGFTVLIIAFQYLISPYIIQWIYRIDWIEYEDFARQFPHLHEAVQKVVDVHGIQTPRIGFIHDGNPNAFTFGHTKNNARIVITDGILQYLDENEQKAVLAHELGHVIHNDFILMTVVFAIPLILLTIARWAYYAVRFSGRGSKDEGSYIILALLAIAVLSYIAYWIGYLVSLFISRIREYYADEHSAELTRNPNYLSTALVKIAYGILAVENEAQIYEKKSSKVNALKGLGIFDPKKASYLAIESYNGSKPIVKEQIQAAAGWDLFNPWAKYFQMFSTHPLPARRIQRLNEQCEEYNVPIEIDFSQARQIKEEQVGKSIIGKFLTDIIVKKLPAIIFWIFVLITIASILAIIGLIPIVPSLLSLITVKNFVFLWFIAFYMMGFATILRTVFMYRRGFEPKKVIDLVTQINVSPVRPIPAIIEGTIVGKGIPGYYFGEDLFFQDDTGLLYVDYRFGLRIVDFFWAITRADQQVGKKVRIRGWYRRGPNPYIQIDRLEVIGERTYKNHSKLMMYILAGVLFLIGLGILYFWFLI
ncbi:MAG: zinc metalloprotease HtpX [Promethearchaeota archaeon]